MSTTCTEWRTALNEMASAPVGSLNWAIAGDLSGIGDAEALDYLIRMYTEDPKGTPEFALATKLLHLLLPAASSALILERRDQPDETAHVGAVSITPPIDEGYWSYRVLLGERQAIVGFPKFSTVGIGFAIEDDWNTNFPYTCGAEEIFQHIRHNKGDESISDDDVRAAIALVQDAIRADREAVTA